MTTRVVMVTIVVVVVVVVVLELLAAVVEATVAALLALLAALVVVVRVSLVAAAPGIVAVLVTAMQVTTFVKIVSMSMLVTRSSTRSSLNRSHTKSLVVPICPMTGSCCLVIRARWNIRS
jgi:hypothetical protein